MFLSSVLFCCYPGVLSVGCHLVSRRVEKSDFPWAEFLLSVIFFFEIESVINRQNIDKCVFESNLRHHKDWFQEKQAIPHHKIQLVYKSK